jgi:hypothetical protein
MPEFQPYFMHVLPNWKALFGDFKLIHADEGWTELWNRIQTIPKSDYNVLRDGFNFTVLNPSKGGLPVHGQ